MSPVLNCFFFELREIMPCTAKSGLLNMITGKHPEQTNKRVYFGVARVTLTVDGAITHVIGREDIERAKADAFIQLLRRDYDCLSTSFSNKRLVIELKNKRSPTKAYLTKLCKAEFFVYHIDHMAGDWDMYYPEIKTHVSTKNLTMKVERYEAFRVADWLAGVTVEFSDHHEEGMKDVDLQQAVGR